MEEGVENYENDRNGEFVVRLPFLILSVAPPLTLAKMAA